MFEELEGLFSGSVGLAEPLQRRELEVLAEQREMDAILVLIAVVIRTKVTTQ
jgi:hypothetical protein